MIPFFRELPAGVRQQRMNAEWTREGSLKSCLTGRVDADGDLDRYLQECMIVHDEWITM